MHSAVQLGDTQQSRGVHLRLEGLRDYFQQCVLILRARTGSCQFQPQVLQGAGVYRVSMERSVTSCLLLVNGLPASLLISWITVFLVFDLFSACFSLVVFFVSCCCVISCSPSISFSFSLSFPYPFWYHGNGVNSVEGCSNKFMSQYKLADHLKSHTKERAVACPTCGAMFASKTKLHDHRKRQLPIESKASFYSPRYNPT